MTPSQKLTDAAAEVDSSHPYDGIYCRDETIRLQDAEIVSLKAEVERLRAALRGVIRVADRKTVEFDDARAALTQEKTDV